jgi:hypothetical protein
VRPQDERDLRNALHAEARRHEPDREAMRERIDQARSAGPRGAMNLLAASLLRPAPSRPAFFRPIAAAVAVAVVLVAAFVGIRLGNRPPAPVAQPTVPVTASPTTSPPPTPSTGTSRSGTAGPAESRTSTRHTTGATTTPPPSTATTSSTPPPTTVVRDGSLSASAALDPHSLDTWSQSNVTVTTTEAVSALVVEVRVARTEGVAKTGHWSSIPEAQVTETVDTSVGDLLYRFTLNAGTTLAPGTYTFAAQFNHAAGARSTAGDTYTAVTTGASVKGTFTP